jgi:ankyrin repeat protein
MNPSIPVAVLLGRSTKDIETLLKEGSDINDVHPQFGTAISQVIQQGHKAALMAFILKSEAGWPLYYALVEGRDDLVDLLLAAGAKLENPNSNDSTNLMETAID